MELWYDKPASSFNDALPIGNGSFGAVVYGGAPREKLSLNLDTFWSGTLRREERKIPLQQIKEVQEKVRSKKYYEAEQLVNKNLLGEYNESYMAFGDIWYEFKNTNSIKNYRRSLNLETAIVETSFDLDDVRIQSEVFASFVDRAIILHIMSNRKNSLSLDVGFFSVLKNSMTSEGTSSIRLIQQAPSHVEPNYVESDNPIIYDDTKPGMIGCCQLKVLLSDGRITNKNGVLTIEYASEITLLVVAEDGYRGYGAELAGVTNLQEKCEERLHNLEKFSYSELRSRHLTDYQALYRRVSFSLGEQDNNLTIPARLLKLRDGKKDNGLFTLFFQYNRYLMISSSRQGSQPANLQGIWNDSIRPVWSSNWTININTEMNYWMVCPCNLLDCYQPLVQMVKELSKEGEKTAQNQYHCKGWVANHNVDLWRQASAVGGDAKYAYWPMGGVWLANQIFDYYRYTLDEDYLMKEARPIMVGASEFCMDWLTKESDGRYHTMISTSPENSFYDEDGNICSVSNSSTMDISLIKELLLNMLHIYDKLGIRDERYLKIKEYLKNMPDYPVSESGMLQEWVKEFNEVEAGHRHFSPIVGFCPGSVINLKETPELVEACKKLVNHRLEHGGGHIGWSCAWLINIFARLHDGNKAFAFLESLLKNSTYDNLFNLHPPLGENSGEREIFQIDANFGSTAGIATMLLQSHLGEIELLPALPDEWKSGEVTGLLAEGGFEVSIYWKNGKLDQAIIRSKDAKVPKVTYKQPIIVQTDGNISYVSCK